MKRAYRRARSAVLVEARDVYLPLTESEDGACRVGVRLRAVVDPRPEEPVVSRRTFVAGTLAVATTACASGRARSGPSAAATTTVPTAPDRAAASPGGPAVFVANGDRTRQQVALTFHLNGDRALVDQLANVLDAHRTVVTAFVVGTWLDANGDFADRLARAGHELANHTYTHPTFPQLTPADMESEIIRCRDTLVRVAQTGGRYFRPSGTSNGIDPPSDAALQAAGDAGYATVVGFDVDPADYSDPGRDAIVSRVAAAVMPGSIVSLHFGHRGTIDAMPGILAALTARGLQPVTTSALLQA
jgi:peptidoglycan/xylan/chitin deacetylase (PgdA/CDA1 family)